MPDTPLMATLLIIARAVDAESKKHPAAAAPYFTACQNAILDIHPSAAVWMWQVVKWQSRIEQHIQDCTACCLGLNPLDCPTAILLQSMLVKHEKRLLESETC
jgi:hypothetical protein